MRVLTLCGVWTLLVAGALAGASAQAGTVEDCCYGQRGNINGSPSQTPDLSDLSLLISYLTAAPSDRPTLPCMLEADVNADGRVDMTDLSCFIGSVLQIYPGFTCMADCPIE